MPAGETLYGGLSLGTWFAIAVLFLATILTYVSARGDRSSRAEDGRKDRESQLAMARDQHEHELALAREEREQARRLVAYSALATYLDAMEEAVRRTLPVFQSVTDPPMPEEPDREEFRRHLSAARLVGAEELRRSLASLWQIRRAFDVAVVDLLEERAHPSSADANDIGDARDTVTARRQAFMDSVNAVEAQMRSDLGIPVDPPARVGSFPGNPPAV